jgi:hypothetical protein
MIWGAPGLDFETRETSMQNHEGNKTVEDQADL